MDKGGEIYLFFMLYTKYIVYSIDKFVGGGYNKYSGAYNAP